MRNVLWSGSNDKRKDHVSWDLACRLKTKGSRFWERGVEVSNNIALVGKWLWLFLVILSPFGIESSLIRDKNPTGGMHRLLCE